MEQERIRHGLFLVTIVESEQLCIDEYSPAMVSYLQIDGKLYFFLRWSTHFLQVF